ncbi:hypothetical protein NDU88_005506 [Pleurodeles waltl]|uniref:Uncharacterized protein n=1 Tax=Pleurodeles waltl TaxID=8319 RepID=A0AAV7UIB6_PLEWA|nr:hypothetical protein NDU88_005506 [Pleurodeles waltl]
MLRGRACLRPTISPAVKGGCTWQSRTHSRALRSDADCISRISTSITPQRARADSASLSFKRGHRSDEPCALNRFRAGESYKSHPALSLLPHVAQAKVEHGVPGCAPPVAQTERKLMCKHDGSSDAAVTTNRIPEGKLPNTTHLHNNSLILHNLKHLPAEGRQGKHHQRVVTHPCLATVGLSTPLIRSCSQRPLTMAWCQQMML